MKHYSVYLTFSMSLLGLFDGCSLFSKTIIIMNTNDAFFRELNCKNGGFENITKS